MFVFQQTLTGNHHRKNLCSYDDYLLEFYFCEGYKEPKFGVVPSIPLKDFDPAWIFAMYFEKVALAQIILKIYLYR